MHTITPTLSNTHPRTHRQTQRHSRVCALSGQITDCIVQISAASIRSSIGARQAASAIPRARTQFDAQFDAGNAHSHLHRYVANICEHASTHTLTSHRLTCVRTRRWRECGLFVDKQTLISSWARARARSVRAMDTEIRDTRYATRQTICMRRTCARTRRDCYTIAVIYVGVWRAGWTALYVHNSPVVHAPTTMTTTMTTTTSRLGLNVKYCNICTSWILEDVRCARRSVHVQSICVCCAREM